MIKKLAVLFKNDIVLLISFCLALLSCLITPPGPEYLGYLDFHTLILLFCLMLIVEGLRRPIFSRTSEIFCSHELPPNGGFPLFSCFYAL